MADQDERDNKDNRTSDRSFTGKAANDKGMARDEDSEDARSADRKGEQSSSGES